MVGVGVSVAESTCVVPATHHPPSSSPQGHDHGPDYHLGLDAAGDLVRGDGWKVEHGHFDPDSSILTWSKAGEENVEWKRSSPPAGETKSGGSVEMAVMGGVTPSQVMLGGEGGGRMRGEGSGGRVGGGCLSSRDAAPLQQTVTIHGLATNDTPTAPCTRATRTLVSNPRPTRSTKPPAPPSSSQGGWDQTSTDLEEARSGRFRRSTKRAGADSPDAADVEGGGVSGRIHHASDEHEYHPRGPGTWHPEDRQEQMIQTSKVSCQPQNKI